MKCRLKIIVNPISGRGRAGKLLIDIVPMLEYAGYSVEVFVTQKSGDARAAASQTAGISTLLVIGSDGTVKEVLNGLIEHPVPLAVLPVGTANVLAKEFDLPKHPEAVARVIRDGRIQWVDLGRFEGGVFALMAGAGFDGVIVRNLHKARTGPIRMWEYVTLGLRTVARYRPRPLTIEVDGHVVEREATFVQIANVSAYGGPLLFSPLARADDGFFDVMWHTGKTRRDTFRLFWHAFFTRNPLRMSDVGFTRGRRIALASEHAVPLQVDGDPGGFLPAHFDLLPRALPLLVPVPTGAGKR
ncbi:MAG: diacylglycerol kinase family lipid kinase [Planctomycetes bacterium]|nr:diacylglycerol kinase family lipid kinase [Planctomycetota bacterium]